MFNKPFKLGVIALSLFTQTLFSQGFGTSEPISEWHFHLGDIKLGGRETLDHTQWSKVSIPHDWTVNQFASPDLASCTGYLPGGIAWYRTHIDIPASDSGKRKYLYFEGVYNNSEVYINGKWLGKRPNGYVSFMYDITPYVRPGHNNVIAVRVDHSEDADSRWYTGSGIYREVHLVTANNIHIDQWGVFYSTNITKKGQARISIETKTRNHSSQSAKVRVEHTLLDDQGNVVGTSGSTLDIQKNDRAISNQELIVSKPKLWSVDHPYLYQLKTTIIQGDRQLDQSMVNVGIRSLTFDANKGFALNGAWMKIKGVCLHHDAGVLGAAVPKAVWRERIVKLREIGVNGIRMSHNPQATDLYDLCDELGMLVMDEAFDEWEYPKKKWITGWNKGEPGFQGPAAYFREWGKKDLASIIYRNRNHPSVIMWSIGNEVDYPNDPYSHPILASEGIGQYHTKGYLSSQPHADRLGDIAGELAAVVRAIDPSRPVTAALAGAVMSNETTYPDALDIVGYNYTENRYKKDHEKYPGRVLYGSETRHDLDAWKAVRDNDFIFGQFIWTGFDYLGEAGPWPSRGFTTGMIDLANNIKPRGYFRKSLWTKEPMAYLGTYPVPKNRSWLSIDAPHLWNYDHGEMVRVVTYTNGDAAELLLNDKVIGNRKDYDPGSGIIFWDVPYAPGTLKVRAYKKGKVVAEDRVTTAGVPVKIEANVGNRRPAAKGDVALIKLKVLDQDGNLANLADPMISCKIDGPAKLLGLENASHYANEDYNTDKLRCKNGKMLAYVQATADLGKITITFEAPYLSSATVNISLNEDTAKPAGSKF